MFRTILCASTALASVWTAAPATAASSSIETVVVTASPIPQNSDQFATIVDTVSRDQILEQGGANLANALEDVPGVAGTGFAAGASRPVIRGMDANRVKILEDGVSSSDVSDIGPDHGVPIDPLAAQRIEVVRGAATLRYGSQAIGGVVNAINNRVPLQMPAETISGEIDGMYGSNADTKQGSAMVDTSLGNFAFHADGFDRHAGNYDIPDGDQDNSFSREHGWSLGSSYFMGNDSRVGAAVVQYNAQYGIPSDTTYIDMKQTKFITDNSLAIDAGPLQKINVQGGYADYQHTENNPDGSVNSTFKNKEWDGRAEAVFGQMGPFAQSALGVQIQNRKFSALGEDSSYLFPTLTQSVAGYVFTDAPIGSALHLQAAGRVEHVHITGTPASNVHTGVDFTPMSGSVALLWDTTDVTKFGLTVSSAARAPAQTELFARGGHDGPGTFETGDPNLKIERANSLEGTLRTKLWNISFEGSLWGAKFDNYIYGFLTGRSCNDDGVCVAGDSEELKELNYVQSNATFWGTEAKASAPLLERQSGTLSFNALADYVRATLENAGNVPRIQPWRAGGGLSWESKQFDTNFMVLNVGSQHQVGQNETPTKGYVELNAQIGWRPFENHPNFQIALVGHNLTDATERDAVALNKDVVVMPGRDIRVLLSEAF